MLRRLLTPRWLALHALAVVAIAACVLLALWQWDRAQQQAGADRERLRSESMPLVDVARVGGEVEGDDVSRLVSATGVYAADDTLLVIDRELDGRAGYWVVTPLEVDDASVLVVRGWVPSASTAVKPTAGEVEVTGRLTPSDSPGGARLQGSAPLPAGHVSSVNSDELAETLGGPLYPGYLVLTDQVPAENGALEPVDPPVPFSVSGGLLQHWSYVAQWLLFAGFVGFVWWRLARDELRHTRDEKPADAQRPTLPGVPV